MDICVVGTGYVGLVAGTCFAETGNDVVCMDVDAAKIDKLNNGHIPIFEPGLEDMVQSNVADGRLRFTTDLPAAVKQSQVIFIAVGTPQDEDGRADLQYVLKVAENIGKAMEADPGALPKIIVDKSTVPVGTADKVRAKIAEFTSKAYHVVSNPEFMKEGAAVQDFLKPDRVVIGCDDEQVAKIMQRLYAPFVRTENPILTMDVRSAEMTKYAANAMLATKISFMNEVANLCEAVGADVDMVRKGIGFDQRIGFQFLFPGVGYGGSCFPKDVKAFIRVGEEHGVHMEIVRAVDEVNAVQKSTLVKKVKKIFGDDLSGKTFALWGLSFKPQTDDMREAPSITTIRGLLEAGATVRANDPQALEVAEGVFAEEIAKGSVTLFDNNYQTLDGSDALIVVTEWNEYRRPNFERVKSSLKTPTIVDGRNLYDPNHLAELGFTYECVGRPRA
ncbi:MAG: UDP-glucose/GDP-mannose dehydrogenase family protein [Deltaproteobacteria bacterium]|nr:UDP-glucose/GDP-mannose dehydrogenase family protein [Deltaproteobacteria bacterium]MCB9488466.1 UDP-glucose/GDP-mannose dehydrogenase family protein [Deltaproteobacteria bacterium]